MLANANGAGERFLTQSPDNGQDDSDPSWSPDGTHLAMASRRHCAAGGFPSCYGQIYVMNADGSGITQLTNIPNVDAYAPVWSPDGRRIAFTGDTLSPTSDFGVGGVYLMNADGTNVIALAGAAGVDAFGPSWSPDGIRIGFSGSRDEAK